MLVPLLVGLAAAGEPVLQVDAAVTLFDTGLALFARPGWRQTLWDADDSVLRTDTHLTPGALVQITPDFLRVGGELTLAPLAILDLKVHGSMANYFGNVHTLVGFDDKADLYGPADRKPLEKQSGRSTRLGVMPVLKAKVGSVVVVFAAEQQWINLSADQVTEPYYFEPESQLLLAHQDQVTQGTNLVAWDGDVGSWKLIAGILTTWRQAAESGDSLLRTGPLFKASQPDNPLSYVLLVQPYVQDRVFDATRPFVALQARYTR
jgi:hypothetical protein